MRKLMRFLDTRLMNLARGQFRAFGLIVGLGLGGGVATVAQALLLAGIVADVFLRGGDLQSVRMSLMLLFAAIVVRALMVMFERAAAHDFASRRVADLRHEVLDRLTDLGPEALGEKSPGEIQVLLTDGLDEVHQWFSDYLPQVALSALVPLMIAVSIVFSDWFSALVLLITAPVIPIFMVLIGNLADARAQKQMNALGRMAAVFLSLIQGLATLKILGRINDKLEVIRSLSEDYRHQTMSVLRIAFLSALVLELVATLSTAVVAVEIGLRLLYGRLAFEEAFLVLLLAPEFYMPLRILGQRFHAGTKGVSAAGRIFEVVSSTRISHQAPAAAGDAPHPAAFTTKLGEKCELTTPYSQVATYVMPSHPVITLEGVFFSYPGRSAEPVLCGVDFVLKPGETLALVGPSGCGKSTLVKVLLRFIEPDEGRLGAEDVDAAEIDVDAWRSQIAWVPQRAHLFADTIENNIRIGNVSASKAQIRRAAQMARAEAFIEVQPQKWLTMIGEGGAKLSGGEAQRLALARAFVRDAPFLVLDEPGAGLDPQTLLDLDESIADFSADRTVLVIAHRLSTAQRADRVAVMNQGRIVQLGAPEDLVRIEGPYRQMIEAREGSH